MAFHQRFSIQSIEDLRAQMAETGAEFPLSEDFSVLSAKVSIGGRVVPNRLVIQPMEGCDGSADGAPEDLLIRRYERFAKGGAGLLWVEATAVVPEGRANPRQLAISPANLSAHQALFERMLKKAASGTGQGFAPYMVLQLTHSGRYSRPGDNPSPVLAARNPYLDRNIPENFPEITDDALEALEDKFVEAAAMACQIGYTAVDIKSCHRYLISELLSAHTREGRYGGSYENRTRFLLNIIDKIKDRLGSSLEITLRLNAYDAIPYPYGWGVSKEDFRQPDLTEPIRLVQDISRRGIRLLNLSCGNPYYNPHVGRPYDTGPYVPPEHPLKGTERMLNIIRDIKGAAQEMTVIATGFTWLREFGVHAAAGGILAGWFDLAGFGRQAFAYPDFARDILQEGRMHRAKCCITCGKCSEIMRDGGAAGCVIRDSEVYGPIYRACRSKKQ